MALEKVETLFEELKQQRDELRVQMHLARQDAKTEWDKLEDKWDEVKPKLDMAKNHTAEATKEVWNALELAGEAIKNGYQRIRRDLD